MDKDDLNEFIVYSQQYILTSWISGNVDNVSIIEHIYSRYTREYVFNLPLDYIIDPATGRVYTVIRGTNLIHSTSGPPYVNCQISAFYIFGCPLKLDSWLPFSSLTEDQKVICVLKYA